MSALWDRYSRRSGNGPLFGGPPVDSEQLARLLRGGPDHIPVGAVHVVGMSTQPLNRTETTGSRTRLLTTEELAEYLQIPARTLEDWRHRDYGPKYARMGKRVRYRQSAVDSWLEEIEAA